MQIEPILMFGKTALLSILLKTHHCKLIFKEMPGKELVQGAMVLAGGIMLLTPGIFTDFLGLSLLFPVTRMFYTRVATKYFKKRMNSGQWNVYGAPMGEQPTDPRDVIIEHPPLDKGGQ